MEFTALIPCKNSKFLDRTVKSLAGQTTPLKEIVVIADGLDVDVSKVAGYDHVRVIRNKTNIGKAKSLNRAVKTVTTEGVLMIDSDTYISHDSMEWMGKYVVGDIGLVIPMLFTSRKKNFVERVRTNWYKRIQRGNITPFGLIGCCFATTKQFMLDHPMPTDTMVEDQELARRLKRTKVGIFQTKRAKCYTEEPQTARALFRQATRWSFGQCQVFGKQNKVAAKLFSSVPLLIIMVSLSSFLPPIPLPKIPNPLPLWLQTAPPQPLGHAPGWFVHYLPLINAVGFPAIVIFYLFLLCGMQFSFFGLAGVKYTVVTVAGNFSGMLRYFFGVKPKW